MKRIVALFVVLVMTMSFVKAQELVNLGDDMPKFQLTSSVYGDVKSADLQGKVVLINLFATWCGPCQMELAEVQNVLWPKYKEHKDFVMLVIGREHTDEQLKKYNERKKFTFPLYPDPKREVFALFAEKSIPRTYLFGKDGKLIYSSMGYSERSFQQLMEHIDKAL